MARQPHAARSRHFAAFDHPQVEAQRLSIEMQLKPEFAVHEPNHPDVPTYADFEV